MYVKMREKKNEPFSNLEKRVMCVVEKRNPITPATSIPKATRIASLATSIEEITPHTKKPRVADKGKGKANLRSSSVWDDIGLVLTRAEDAFTIEDLKALFRVPSNELVGRHIHKLV